MAHNIPTPNEHIRTVTVISWVIIKLSPQTEWRLPHTPNFLEKKSLDSNRKIKTGWLNNISSGPWDKMWRDKNRVKMLSHGYSTYHMLKHSWYSMTTQTRYVITETMFKTTNWRKSIPKLNTPHIYIGQLFLIPFQSPKLQQHQQPPNQTLSHHKTNRFNEMIKP